MECHSIFKCELQVSVNQDEYSSMDVVFFSVFASQNTIEAVLRMGQINSEVSVAREKGQN